MKHEQTRYQWTLRDEKRVIRLKFYARESANRKYN